MTDVLTGTFLAHVALWAAVGATTACVLIVVAVSLAPDALLHDYPPSLQERHGPQSRRGARVDAVFGVLLVVVWVTIGVVAVLRISAVTGGDVGFVGGAILGVLTIVMMTAIDTVVIDWLLFCRLQLPIFVLPGTEGDPAYRDYGFHVRVLWPRGLLLVPAIGVAYGLLALLVEALA